jgi:hypothetical protein
MEEGTMSIDPNIVIPAGMLAIAGFGLGIKLINGKSRDDCNLSRDNEKRIIKLETQYKNIDGKLERILDKVNGKT